MKDMGTSLLFAALILVLSCSPAWAQATAQINGTVKDQTGALLPGVQVTATQTATGFARSAVTDEVGIYIDGAAGRSLQVGSGPFGLPDFCANRNRAAGREHSSDQHWHGNRSSGRESLSPSGRGAG